MNAGIKKEKKSSHSRIFWQLLLLAGLVLIIRSDLIKSTLAVIRDREKSEDNKFQAGELGFGLTSVNSPDTSGFQVMAMAIAQPEALYVREIIIKNEAGSMFDYDVMANNFSGDLCDQFNVKADWKGDGTSEYNDELKNFTYTVEDFSGEDLWKFEVNLKDGAKDWQGKKCEFDFIFIGRQKSDEVLYPDGFSDKKTFHNTVETGTAEEESTADVKPTVIDKVLPAGFGRIAARHDGTSRT